jgi:hypothetical protein
MLVADLDDNSKALVVHLLHQLEGTKSNRMRSTLQVSTCTWVGKYMYLYPGSLQAPRSQIDSDRIRSSLLNFAAFHTWILPGH